MKPSDMESFSFVSVSMSPKPSRWAGATAVTRAISGEAISGQIFDFAGVVGASSSDDDLAVGFGGEEGKRQADEVIEIFWRLECFETSRQTW